MTSNQPPPPGGPGGQPQGAPPPYAQQPGPAAPPPYGQPGYAPPPPGYGPPPGPGRPAFGQPAGGGTSFDLKRLKMADYVIAGGTVLYLVWALLPWYSIGIGFYYGSLSGFGFSGLVTFSFVLLLLATAWAVLPAFMDLKVGFPRGWITVGVAGLGLVLTLIAWINSLSYGFSIWALVALVTAAAVTGFAFLRLLPELGNRPGLPGSLAGAAQWANQQAPNFPGAFGQPGQPAQPGAAYGQPGTYAPPQPGPYVPPQPGRTGGPAAPPPPYGPPAGGAPANPGAGPAQASPGEPYRP